MYACFSSHFANSRRKTASPTICNGVVKLTITRLYDHIGDLFLGNWGTDLHRCTSLCIDLTAHFARREGGTMYAITSRSSTEHNNQVAWLGLARMATTRQDTQTTTEDQRIIEISWMIKNGTIHSWNAHLIAVVTHTVYHAASNAPRRENASG